MDFNAAQMREDALIAEGQYKFRVRDAREKRSASGNDMMNLKLIIFMNGREVQIWDSLILMPSMFWKVEHFCAAVGLSSKLEEGRIMAQDCIDKEGTLDIVRKIDNQTGELQNKVKDYIKPEIEEPILFDEDVPNF